VDGMSAHSVAVRENGFMARSGRADVLAAAHAECQARGWPWREPAKVTGGLFRFRVWTNANMIDNNPWFLFSRNGRLVRAGWARRSQQ
jgi:hypothetical protein